MTFARLARLFRAVTELRNTARMIAATSRYMAPSKRTAHTKTPSLSDLKRVFGFSKDTKAAQQYELLGCVVIFINSVDMFAILRSMMPSTMHIWKRKSTKKPLSFSLLW